MADKVYGICGTNKCRREVIEKIVVTDTSTEIDTSEGDYHLCATLPLPDGYTRENSMILGIQVRMKMKSGRYEYLMLPYSIDSGTLIFDVYARYNMSEISVNAVCSMDLYSEIKATALVARYA